MSPNIFRKYDIRGVYGREFDEAFARQLGRACVSLMRRKRKTHNIEVAVGWDARHSSPGLADGLIKGLVESGAKVVKLGLVSSPVNYFATFALGLQMDGVMITGSHNPPECNGFKISVQQKSIFGADVQALKDIILKQDFVSGQGSVREHDILLPYVNKYKKEFGDLSGVKVVLDCGNGAAGCVARRLYEACGVDVDVLFETPDGSFPNHHPDPSKAENLQHLIQRVQQSRAQVGLAVDGDADRIGVVDRDGRIILADDLMVLYARHILKQHPGATIVGDVKCSNAFFADVKRHGGQALMWQTGCSIVRDKVRTEKAPFGGELSGHVFFNDRNFGYDDALYAGLRLIEILKLEQKSVGELLADLPKRHSTPEIRTPMAADKIEHTMARIRQRAERDNNTNYEACFIDGVRVVYPDAWALVRPSHTEPYLTLRFEAQTPERLRQLKHEWEALIHGS